MVTLEQKWELLERLYENSRVHTNELAEEIGLSRQTISKFTNSLWNHGVIHSPTILINPHVLNLQYFFMEIKTNPSEPELLAKIKNIDEIVTLDGILGEYSLILKFEVQTKKQFAELLNQIDQNIAQSLFSSYRIIECIDIYKMGGFMLSPNYPVKAMDEGDKKWRLLQMLRKNHNLRKWPEREKYPIFTVEESEYLSHINLSREFANFVEDHIISRFTVTYDPKKILQFLRKTDRNIQELDFSTKFYLQIRPQRISEYSKLAKMLQLNPYIIDLYRTGNEAGLLAIVRTKGLAQYNKFIQNLYQNYPIRDTYTTVVVEERIPSIFPPNIQVAKNMLSSTSTKE